MKTNNASFSCWLASFASCALLLGAARPATAQVIWTNTGFNTVGQSASFNTAANWNPNFVPFQNAAIITNAFGVAGHTNPLITLDAAQQVSSLTYADSGKSNFSATLSAGTSGTLSFVGTTPTVDSLSNSTLTISAPVQIPAAGLTKGPGIGNVTLSGAISGGGPLTVNGGTLTESSGLLTGFGGVAGSVVTNGGTLALGYGTSGTYANFPITLYGNGSAADGQGALDVRSVAEMTFPGTITLGSGGARIGQYSAASFLVLANITGSGPLTLDAGGGSYTAHTGLIQLNGIGTYSGNTTFYQNGGLNIFMVKLGNNNRLPTNTVVTMSEINNTTATGIIFNLNGYSQQLGGLMNDSVATSTKYMVVNSSSTAASSLTFSNTAPYKFSGVIGTNATGGVGDNINLLQIGNSTETLSGVNFYTGSTTISNGAIVGVVGGSSANSAVTVSPAAGTGTLAVSVNNINNQWTCASLTTDGAGTPDLDFNFGLLTPGTATAPLNVTGNVNFNTMPTISIESAGFQVTGTPGYPLMTWSGTGPSSISITPTLPPGVVGSLSISGNTLYLQITTPSPTQPLTWQPGNNGTWDTTTTADWKDALGGNYAYDDGYDSVVFDSTGGGGTVTLNATYSPLSVTANNASYTISGSGGIAGLTGVEKDGAGTLTLETVNTYAGTNAITGGTLAVSSGGTLGGTGAAVILSGGTLDLGGESLTNGAVSITTAAASGNTIQNGSLAGSSYAASLTSGNAMVTAGLGGNGGLTMNGTGGTLTLSGANTYKGATAVSEGELDIENWGATGLGTMGVANLAASSATLGISGGTLAFGANQFAVGSGVGATAIVNQSGGTVSFTGGVSLLIGNGGGNTDTYNLSGGTVTSSAVAGVRIGVNTAYDSATFNLSGTGVLNLSGAQALQVGRSDGVSSSNTVAFYQTGGTATVNNVTVGGGATSTNVTATLSVTGGSFTATNFATLAGQSASTATMTLGASAQVTLPAFPAPVGTANLTLDFTTGYLAPYAASANYLTNLTGAYLTANGANFNVASGNDITVGQILQNAPLQAGTLTKTGVGTLTLAGANTYTGNTTIKAGTLALGASGSLSANSSVSIAAGATFDVSALAGYTLGNSATLTASGNASPATINGGSSGTINLGSQGVTLNFDGTDAALTVSQGTLALSGNTFTVVTGSALAPGVYTLVSVPNGISGTVNSTPAYGSGSGVASGCTGVVSLSMGNNAVILTVSASITATQTANGTIAPGGTTVVPYNTSQSYTITPNAGYQVATLTVDGGSVTPATSYTFNNVVATHTITATYSAITYTLTYTAGAGGSISGATPQTVNYGANGSAVTAVANAGYAFTTWSDGSPANPRTDNNVMNNISVTANFAVSSVSPVRLTNSVSGTQMVLNWPGSLGWNLQAQTNALNGRITTNAANWFTLAATPPYTNTINRANPSVFYRLQH